MNKSLLLLLAALPALAACSTETRYEDPEAVETIDARFGQTDLQVIAETMTQSFLQANVWGEGEKPTLLFGGVTNVTKQHVDTKNITDTIRTALVQSGKFRIVVGDQGLGEIQKEVDYQQSGAVDPTTAVELGKQRGAEYVLYGRFSEIAKKKGDIHSRFMKFTLNAVNVQTRELVWAEEKQISKITS
ncbi:MAG: penicillin-binding protein activator LpoB [Planctomycetota bacterium]|nr:MAG: penicillin-binding protein activator LpoB [Planctomycetota bacterium]